MKAVHIDGKPCAWFERKRNGVVERVLREIDPYQEIDPKK